MPVSAVDSVQPALQHARSQLFTNFRWGQWLRLALVGILAAELHVGGCNLGNAGNWHRTMPRSHGDFTQPGTSRDLLRLFHLIHPTRISEHFAQFLGLIVIAIFAAFVLGMVFLFISSVFRFILFDSVLRRHCSISEGWQKWRHAGGQFFLWQIVFQTVAMLALGILIGLPLALALAAGWTADLRAHIGRTIVSVIVLFGLFALFVLVAIVVQVLAKDFLVPVMALENLDFAEGWHHLLTIIGREKGRFAAYLLLKFVLSIAAAILFSIIALIPTLLVVVPSVVAVVAGRAVGLGWTVTTASLAIIFGTLLILVLLFLIALVSVPATVFFPAYAMYFLAARYPNLDALLNPAPAPELPPIPAVPAPFEPPPLPPSAEPI